jgi:WD40 repeat protein
MRRQNKGEITMISDKSKKEFEIIYRLEPNLIYTSKGLNAKPNDLIENNLNLHLANPLDIPIFFHDVKHRIYSVALTEDGNKALFGSDDGAVRVWDLVENKLLFESRDHRELVSSIAVTGNGEMAVSGSWDETALVIG